VNYRCFANAESLPRAISSLFRASEINYLCVHKKLRSKRLAPVLIKEVTRQVHLKGIFQAIYTAGVLLPTPVSTCRWVIPSSYHLCIRLITHPLRYYHRSLNIPKLVEVNFTHVPRNQTLARMIRLNKLSPTPHLADPRFGLREMQEKDVSEVADLFTRYMQRFDMAPIMTVDEVRHQFLSGSGTGEVKNGRRDGQVTWSYVIEVNPYSSS
jgi:glycylpeptide N-tetradecanoyltransferase